VPGASSAGSGQGKLLQNGGWPGENPRVLEKMPWGGPKPIRRSPELDQNSTGDTIFWENKRRRKWWKEQLRGKKTRKVTTSSMNSLLKDPRRFITNERIQKTCPGRVRRHLGKMKSWGISWDDVLISPTPAAGVTFHGRQRKNRGHTRGLSPGFTTRNRLNGTIPSGKAVAVKRLRSLGDSVRPKRWYERRDLEVLDLPPAQGVEFFFSSLRGM